MIDALTDQIRKVGYVFERLEIPAEGKLRILGAIAGAGPGIPDGSRPPASALVCMRDAGLHNIVLIHSDGVESHFTIPPSPLPVTAAKVWRITPSSVPMPEAVA